MWIGNPRWPLPKEKVLTSYVKTLSFGDGHLGFPIIHAQFLLISL
jgi:hypothetical protein